MEVETNTAGDEAIIMKDYGDTSWVELWLEDNREAFAKLVEFHADAVYNLAYQLCGNCAMAEDIAQEAFIRAYQRRRLFKPEYPFRNWILRICANLCRSNYRSWRRKKNAEQAYAAEREIEREIRYRADNGMSESVKKLNHALMSLSVRLRMPIILKYMEDMTIQEVADVLEIRLSAAKMRLARGREQLRRLMEYPGGI